MSISTFPTLLQGDRFLRRKEVCDLLGISRSHLYKQISVGKLPAPRKLGSRTSVWLSSQVYAVMQAIMGEAA